MQSDQKVPKNLRKAFVAVQVAKLAKGEPMNDNDTFTISATSTSTAGRQLTKLFPFRFLSKLAAVLILLMPLCGYSQQTTGDIVGTVTDGSGAAVPTATVTVTNLGTHDVRILPVSGAGDYVANLLNPGDYSITVTAPGFRTLTVARITLLAGDRARADAPLVIGSASETVEVTSISPALQTDDSSVTSTVGEQATQQLPLNGRNFITLTQTLPGANEGRVGGLNSGAQADDRRQTSSISVNGQGSVLNNQEIDGMDNNEKLIGTIGIRPSIEAISELRVQSGNYAAESGRAGGGVINVITKSGTNQFHGAVFEFLRNDKLNTFPFLFGATLKKPILRQNQFGGAVGGPILKDKAFFFADYEGFRIVNGTLPSSLTVPTQYEHDNPGDFTDVGGVDYNLTPSAIDAIGAAYFKFYPAPNTGTNQYVGSASNIQNSDAIDARIDYKFSDKDSLFFRASYNNVKTTTTGVFPQVTVSGATFYPNINLAISPDKAVGSQLNYVHMFSPNLLLEAKAGYTFIDNGSTGSTNASVNNLLGQPNANFFPGLAYVTVSKASFLGNGSYYVPLTDLDNTFQYLASVNYTVGKHDMKFGGGLIRRQNTSSQSNAPDGLWNFTDLPSLYQGNYTSVSRVASLVDPHFRSWEASGYAQDDWHARSNLTVNFGVRYDVFTPFIETKDRISNFDDVNGKILVAGANSDRQVGIKNDFSNLSPRIGFSATVLPSLVLRGAYALVFFPTNLTSIATFKNAPFTSSYGPYTPATAPTGYQKFANGLPVIAADSYTDPVGQLSDTVSTGYQASRLEQFNLGIQKDFSGNTISVTYIGSVGRHLSQIIADINAATPNASGAVVAQTLRPYYAKLPGVTAINNLRTEGVGYYNALQVVYERRLKHGLYVNSNLTYSRNIDNALGVDGSVKSEGTGSLPAQVSTRDYGNSALDLRVRVTTLINYNLPFGSNLKGIVGVLAKGWQANALNIWSTSAPFTVVNAVDVDGTRPGVATADRPNQEGSIHVAQPANAKFFNTAAFVAQTAGTLGSERVNQLYGPHFRHLDVSLFKTVPIRQEMNVQFRTEVFNIFNMANFALPNATLSGASFGQITATSANYTPRLIQFALKLQF